ncbi:MAG: hypothetical protein N4A49_16690 [Marinifilaceae bacterium]|nr:hypothetical protein [Marinifilaceae bacterium]
MILINGNILERYNCRKIKRYYISNENQNPNKAIELSRKYWAAENNLQFWRLDVFFCQDKHTKRDGNSAENFSLINKFALSILKKDKSFKACIRSKRLSEIIDMEYIESILKNSSGNPLKEQIRFLK